MIILITEPEFRTDESLLLNRMLKKHPEPTIHLRKPAAKLPEMEALLENIDPEFHVRLVVHQHHRLVEKYLLKGMHFTTSDREKKPDEKAVSTSFHALSEAQTLHEKFRYFFCSPIFPSISKAGYSTEENWDIRSQQTTFREKAVALGGINSERLEETFQLGFRHIAVLGAIWQDADPEAAFDRLTSAYSRTIATFTDSDQL